MALTNIEVNVILDLYDHNLTQSTIKAIALDKGSRYVKALIRDRETIYDIGADTQVVLTVIRPDKAGVQITGQPRSYTSQADDGSPTTVYGAYAELTQTALAIKGTLQAQFKFENGQQILRSEIFTINNGVALDAETDTWAGEYQGYNLDELVQNVNTAVGKVDAMEDDVSDLKEGFNDLYNAAFVTDSANGGVAHFEDGADSIPMKSVKVNISPVQGGSGDPSPENVRPISGFNSVKVTRAGKNVITPLSKTESGLTLTPQNDGGVLINGTYTGTTGWVVISSYVSLKAGQTYALSASGTENTFGLNGYGSTNPVTPTADFTSNFRLRIENGQTFNNVKVYPQVEVGATPTEFEIGTSEATNISLSSAGTVYGGTLDVVSGELKVTHGYIASYSGQALPSAWISDRDVYVDGTRPTTGAQVVYQLAASTTYNLTPTEVKSLLGINNVWSDVGDVEVEYRADTKLYINKKIAEVTA